MFLELALEFTNAMNTGKIPVIKTSLERVIELETRKYCENAVKKFHIMVL